MSENERYEEFLWPDPIGLLRTLVANSPEVNVKVALINVIDYLVGDEESEGGPRSVDANDMMEVMAQSLAYLHHHVGEEEYEHDNAHAQFTEAAPKSALPAPTAEELLALFREQLGETEGGEK